MKESGLTQEKMGRECKYGRIIANMLDNGKII
jgi:hypothetical protein